MSARGCELKFERLSKLEKVWKDLFNTAGNASPFCSYEWFSALARNVLGLDPEVTVFQDGTDVIGILAATVSSEEIRSIADERVTDLNDLLSLPGQEKKIAETLADFVLEKGLRLDLFPFEVDSALIVGLRCRLDEIKVDRKDTCPLLELPPTWDDYLRDLDGKSRHELRRKMRRINETVLHDVKSADVDILFRLMTVSDNSKKEFLTPDIMAFFKELINAFDRNGWLRLRALYSDDKPVGIILAFALKGRVFLYNMGFDPAYRHMSPGIMAVALDIQSAISEGYEYYDFLRGDEGYKYRFGAHERYTVRLTR
ncbi:MAG: GNAT family N-acetyltransferase [candidate division WOR-3 bacterium]|nr:MAG: GNAT family N-acetyltransferase [candidate division WOR-3 bacterium]